MKRTLLACYALAVCFVTIICFAITLGKATYNVVEIKHPEFTINSSTYQRLQSNESYCEPERFANKVANKCNKKTSEEITQLRESAYKIALNTERRDALQGLVISLIIIFINLLIFVPHWIIARRAS